MTNKEVKYIYNPAQVNFYLEKGCKLIKTGVNPKTDKRWFMFYTDDTKDAYSEWCNRKYN